MTISECAEPWPSHPWPPGPLASHITWFAERLAEQGYAPFTTQEKLRLVMHLSQWLQEQHVGAEALDEPCIGQFLQYRQQQGRAPRHHRVTLRTFLTELRDAGTVWPVLPGNTISLLCGVFSRSVLGPALSCCMHSVCTI